MNDDDKTPAPTPPRLSPVPSYAEKQAEEAADLLRAKQLVEFSKKQTGDISLEEVAREVKRTARRRKKAWPAALLGMLVSGGAGGTGIFKAMSAHDRNAVLEERVRTQKEEIDRLRNKLDVEQLELARCCPP